MVVSTCLDLERRVAVVELSSGVCVASPLDGAGFDASSRVARFTYTPAFDWLVAETTAGDVVRFELPGPDSPAPLGGRLVVYLDQNQWSAVAKSLHDPSRVPEEDRVAALRLVGLVGDGRVVLPASGAHYFETTVWADAARRYELGLTVLRLSRGWQLRHPVMVRREELLDLLLGRPADRRGPGRDPVMTLAAGQVLEDDGYVAPEGLGAEEAFRHHTVTSASVLIDVMLDGSPVERGLDLGWAEGQGLAGAALRSAGLGVRDRRVMVDLMLAEDLLSEAGWAAMCAGLDPAGMAAWLVGPGRRAFAGAPSVGVYAEVFRGRHADPSTGWERNDLHDMVYLSCAAGYADVVVCERHEAGVLNAAASRLGRPRRAFRRLRDAVPVVESMLG